MDITHIAKLAKLNLSEAELAHYKTDLDNILTLANKLESIDTKNIEPMAHPMDLQQVLRPDTVSESNQREKLQSIAPEVADGLYLVPKVIEAE